MRPPKPPRKLTAKRGVGWGGVGAYPSDVHAAGLRASHLPASVLEC